MKAGVTSVSSSVQAFTRRSRTFCGITARSGQQSQHPTPVICGLNPRAGRGTCQQLGITPPLALSNTCLLPAFPSPQRVAQGVWASSRCSIKSWHNGPMGPESSTRARGAGKETAGWQVGQGSETALPAATHPSPQEGGTW